MHDDAPGAARMPLPDHAGTQKRRLLMGGTDELGLRRALAERGVDVAVPNVARIYDYFLGGDFLNS